MVASMKPKPSNILHLINKPILICYLVFIINPQKGSRVHSTVLSFHCHAPFLYLTDFPTKFLQQSPTEHFNNKSLFVCICVSRCLDVGSFYRGSYAIWTAPEPWGGYLSDPGSPSLQAQNGDGRDLWYNAVMLARGERSHLCVCVF